MIVKNLMQTQISRLRINSIEQQKLLLVLINCCFSISPNNFSSAMEGRLLVNFLEKRWNCALLSDHFLDEEMYDRTIRTICILLSRGKGLAAARLIHAIEKSNFIPSKEACLRLLDCLRRVQVKQLDHSTYHMLRIFVNVVLLETYVDYLPQTRTAAKSHVSTAVSVLQVITKFRFYNEKLFSQYTQLLPRFFFPTKPSFSDFLSICFQLTKVANYNSCIVPLVQSVLASQARHFHPHVKLKLWILIAHLELRESFARKELLNRDEFFLFWRWNVALQGLFAPEAVEDMLKGCTHSPPIFVDFYTHKLLSGLYRKNAFMRGLLSSTFVSLENRHNLSQPSDDIDNEFHDHLLAAGPDFAVEKELQSGSLLIDFSVAHAHSGRRTHFELQGPFHFHRFGQIDFESVLRCAVKMESGVVFSLDKEILSLRKLDGSLGALVRRALQGCEANFVELNYAILEQE